MKSKNYRKKTRPARNLSERQNTGSRQTKISWWRILKIDSLLQGGGWLTSKQISGAIEDSSYSIRTMQRDIDFMRNTLNAPIESGRKGYRYTEPNFFIKSIPLSEGEAFALTVLNPLLEQYRNTSLEGQLRSVFTKITACLPDRITLDVSFLDPKLTFIPDQAENIHPDCFQTVFDSLKTCRTLSFEYRPLQKSTYMERKLDPYHVVCQRGNWYVLGHCHDKDDVRIFSLSRMRNISVTNGRFEIPADFKVSDYFDAEMGVWLNGGKTLTVELLFSQEVGTYALNRIWHSDQVVEERKDGSVYVKFSTDQRQELLRWVLGQGHTVKVLAPPEFADEVRKEAAQVAAMYS